MADQPRCYEVGSWARLRRVDAVYTDEERKLLLAVDAYRRKHRLRFVTCTEVLAILQELGYRKAVETDRGGQHDP